MSSPRPLALLVALVLGLTACGTTDGSDAASGRAEDGLHVVTTTTLLGDLVTRVVGDDAHVEVLMAPGQDPHGYAPSAQQAQQVREADLVVANGLGLEEGLLDALEAAEADGATVVRIAEEVEPIPFDRDAHADEDADAHADGDEGVDGHDHAEGDPHVWFDPRRMAAGVRLVAAELASVDDDVDWEQRADVVVDELEQLDAEVADVLAAVPDECRVLVTNHESLGYLAERYDLEVVATVVPGTSTQAEPSARQFADLAALLRRTRVPAIFTETTQPSRLVDTLAAEVGRDIEVVALYTGALGEPGSGADTYAGMMRTDARLIATALEDC